MTGTRRTALVLVDPPGSGAVGRPPPGVDPAAWSEALVEDAYEVLASLAQARAGLAAPSSRLTELAALTWPGAVLVACDAASTPDRADDAAALAPTGVLADHSTDRDPTGPDPAAGPHSPSPTGSTTSALTVADALAAEADVLVLLAPDAPDIPALHLGKLFQALEDVDLAWSPVADGGVAALGFALPVRPWVRALQPGLDGDPAGWKAAAPTARAALATPGWHRLRNPADLRHLDPGLSGWENTRALLAGRPLG